MLGVGGPVATSCKCGGLPARNGQDEGQQVLMDGHHKLGVLGKDDAQVPQPQDPLPPPARFFPCHLPWPHVEGGMVSFSSTKG